MTLKKRNQLNKLHALPRTKIWRERIGISSKGRESYWKGKKNPAMVGHKWNLGKHYSKEHRLKISKSQIGLKAGSKHPNWKGGITPLRYKIYNSMEYKLWRKAVYERDNYTCIWCGQIGGKLNADHIKPFAQYPELRFAIDNGRTLCLDCHKKTDTYAGKSGWK